MGTFRIISAACVVALCLASPAGAVDRYYTYAGAVLGGGSNHIDYSGWVDDSRENLDIAGSCFFGGLAGCVFIRWFIGELTIQYMVNSNDGGDVDASVSHLCLTMVGKYAYSLSPIYHLTAGAGMYADLPPATNGYEGGAGGIMTLGTMIVLGPDVRMLVDLYLRYGSFGLGEDSTMLSYGAALSAVYNVGRI